MEYLNFHGKKRVRSECHGKVMNDFISFLWDEKCQKDWILDLKNIRISYDKIIIKIWLRWNFYYFYLGRKQKVNGHTGRLLSLLLWLHKRKQRFEFHLQLLCFVILYDSTECTETCTHANLSQLHLMHRWNAFN